MMPSRARLLSAALCAGSALLAWPGHAQAQSAAETRPGVTEFAPDHFEGSQPNTALDMVILLPGFRLQEGSAELRGYSGAAANVLIDGQRPASKQETVEELLRRIPARSVERIELVSSATAGFDMQGYALIANIVRKGGAAVGGRIETEYARFGKGPDAPKLAGQISYGDGNWLLELAGTAYREIAVDHGFGSRNRYAPDGAVLRINQYSHPEWESVKQVSGTYRRDMLGGKIRVDGLYKDSILFADIANRITFPSPSVSIGRDRDYTQATEASVQFERPLGGAARIELVAIRRDTGIRRIDRAIEGSDAKLSDEASQASETILRALLRFNAGPFAIETGMEGARNIVDSSAALEDNGVAIPLPAANIRLAEDRGEAFATLGWRPLADLSVETGLRGEVSRLAQSGDSNLAKSLFFLKPRLASAWTASGSDTFRLLVEREVGQLDFANFTSRASLNTGTVTVGNKDIEPDSLWRLELVWERRLGKGYLALTVRHEAISDVVDHMMVFAGGGVFDAMGNIGRGRREELQADLMLPVDDLGLPGITLRATTLARRSRATDPVTGEPRAITNDLPFEGELSLTHDLPRWKLRWGATYEFATDTPLIKIDDWQSGRLGARLEAFAEYKPDARWTFRLFGKNLTDSPFVRDRHVYAGLRSSGAPSYLEHRVMYLGAYFGASVQRAFGR